MNEKKSFFEVADSIIQEAYHEQVVAQQKFMKSPLMQAMIKDTQDKWNALPWYKKKYKRLQGWIYWKRRTVGEWIAGDKFES